MKHFITTISLNRGLSAINYKNAEGADYLDNDREFTNPVLVPMKNLPANGEKIRVTAIVTNDKDGNCRRNLEKFKDEVEKLCGELGFEYGGVEEISVDYAESTAKHLDLFEMMIEHIHDGDEIVADITYGNKPTPIAVQLALSFAYHYKENTVIKALTYGEVDHNEKNSDGNFYLGYIYDVSALFYMNSVMSEMMSAKPEDPLGFIKMLLGKGEDGND
ncbi:MAG: hypothetical protein NC120_03690 [Ruminococcus sp.]|nr:hypothetical protein [Ruminococcus sp.]